MEELSSTAKLDKQIFDDARRKAEKIQKNTETEIAATKEKWGSKLKEAMSKEQAKFSAQVTAFKAETDARLALDKRRIQWKKTEEDIQTASVNFVCGTAREKLLNYTEAVFAQRVGHCFQGDLSVLKTSPVSLSYTGISRVELDALLEKVLNLSDYSHWDITELAPRSCFGDRDLRVVLDLSDVSITVSIAAEAAEMLLDRRTELVSALFGRSLNEQ
ncbi:MAG: hypothetical protein LBV68_05165 [Spirochaetaceae bacterium]|jgi:vacuolar-type H+-ATPase subunit E/Vma4|nr:hypothetical protein [Spirochaetaceae bacterium]